MARHRPVRVLVSVMLTTLLLIVAPLAHSNRALATAGPTATQTLTMTVPLTGILTVSTASGAVAWNYPDSADLGQLSFTNTLNETTAWSVTAAMTDLVSSTVPATCGTSSTDCLAFTNVQLTTSSSFTGLAGATTLSMQHGSPGLFSGADATPGTTMSASRSVVTDGGTDKGSYTQGDSSANDNKLAPTTGLPLQPGSYSGTLQYTITG